jgi:hypothetical protein
MKKMMRTMNAPVTKPPMNKPLITTGERELMVADSIQLVQSTATTPTSIPSTIKEKGA